MGFDYKLSNYFDIQNHFYLGANHLLLFSDLLKQLQEGIVFQFLVSGLRLNV